jgi:hypothetical protein
MIYHIIRGKVWILNTNRKLNTGNGIAIPELAQLPNPQQVEWSVTMQ